ncbi:MAG TPA: cadherin-like beta sandwich domain-containing protein [Spirochaetota bacterium]|nr:cadherin-like beta sandwich domain-containing protein [Spirochaetota bacterium]
MCAVILIAGGCSRSGSSTNSNLPSEINANLSGLSLSSGTLSPGFNKDTTSYSVEVPYSVNSITVTPEADADESTITVNGYGVSSGTESFDIIRI